MKKANSLMRENDNFHIPQYHHSVTIHEPFGNLFRIKHVLILMRDSDGLFILGDKPGFYPKGIVRLIGGGVSDEESFSEAAIRELNEEVHIKKSAAELYPLAMIITDADTAKQHFKLVTSIYFLQLHGENVTPDGDIRRIVRLNDHGMSKLIKKYYDLDDNNWYHGPEGNHSWGDYGKVYGFIHEIALKEFKKQF